MLIAGVRTYFQLDIEGPQFPHASDEDDANWLLATVSVICDRGSWNFRAPCLTLSEAEGLARWLRRAASHELSAGVRLEFTEPVLAFEFVSDSGEAVVLRLFFAHEGLPPFARQYEDYSLAEQFQPEPVDIEVPVERLMAAGYQLQNELQAKG